MITDLAPVGTVVGWTGDEKDIPEGWEKLPHQPQLDRRCNPTRLNPFDPTLAAALRYYRIIRVK